MQPKKKQINSIKIPISRTSPSTPAHTCASRKSSNISEVVLRSSQGSKYGRYTTSPTFERQSILPRASSTGNMKTHSSYYNTAISVAGVGNTIMRQVSGIVHERQSGNISYAAAVRNKSDLELESMIVKVHDQSIAPKISFLFEESLDKDGKIVADVSRFTAGLTYRYFYANCLHIWGLWYQWAKLIKHLPITNNILNANEVTIGKHLESYYQDIQVHCSQCGSKIPLDSSKCMVCSEATTFKCSVCQLSCHGVISFCSKCQHGGHIDHYQDWFKNHRVCPTGCGCICRID